MIRITGLRFIRLIARVWGTSSILFILYFFSAYAIGSITGNGEGIGTFSDTSEIFAFIFFPVFTVIGLGLAYKREGLGGIITIQSMIGFHAFMSIEPSHLIIDLLMFPGFIYITCWIFAKRKRTSYSQ